jgi:diketogulonate reductase-like aldo/keto reductase
MNLTESVRLNNGVEIPRVGLGVYQSPRGAVTQNAVRDALRADYRHVDTAQIYGNEADVGTAVRASGIPRADVFVTTKLWNDDQGYDAALRAFDATQKRIGLDYVDLYLLHWPVVRKRLDSWRALERLVEEGRVRAIGVSNFMVHHLEELLAHAKVPPAMNQIELSPFLQQREVDAFCEKHGIVVEAYSPLTRGERLADPVVVHIAQRLARTPAQVLLRWGLQHGFVVLPKSTHADRIRENRALFDFEIPAPEMTKLDGLEEGLVTGWDPRKAP